MEGSSGRGGVFGKGREGDVLCRSAPLNPSPAYFISEGGRVGTLTVYKYKPALEILQVRQAFPSRGTWTSRKSLKRYYALVLPPLLV